MNRRAALQSALDAEVNRWSALSVDDLASNLSKLCTYQIEKNGSICQFEVEILQNQPAFLHVDVRVDDGRLPYSIRPLGRSFIKKKGQFPS